MDPISITHRNKTKSSLLAENYLNSAEVMELFGYTSTAAFYAFCRNHNVPLCQLNQRKIIFPESRLSAWIAKRSSGQNAGVQL